MKKRIFFNLLVLILSTFQVKAQMREGVKYEKGFKLNDGIYLTIDQLRSNSPLTKNDFITTLDTASSSFYKDLVNQETIYFLSAGGTKQQIETNSLFGYCSNHTPYIWYERDFHRIVVVGEICYFLVVDQAAPNRSGFSIGVGVGGAAGGVGVGIPIGGGNQTVKREIILDLSTGKYADLKPSELKTFIADDPETKGKYEALSKRKQKKMVYQYVRYYNENNPLYFPEEN